MSPGESLPSLGTRASTPGEPRVVGLGSTKPPTGSLGAIVNGITLPLLGSWTHIFFLLGHSEYMAFWRMASQLHLPVLPSGGCPALYEAKQQLLGGIVCDLTVGPRAMAHSCTFFNVKLVSWLHTTRYRIPCLRMESGEGGSTSWCFSNDWVHSTQIISALSISCLSPTFCSREPLEFSTLWGWQSSLLCVQCHVLLQFPIPQARVLSGRYLYRESLGLIPAAPISPLPQSTRPSIMCNRWSSCHSSDHVL